MAKKLSERIKELKLDESKINDLIMTIAKKFSGITKEELKTHEITEEYFVRVSSLIMQLHIMLEFYIDEYITEYFNNTHSDHPPFYSRDEVFKKYIIKNFTFYAKVNILRQICPKLRSYLTTLEKINNLRNAFAHGFQLEHKYFKYKNDEHILEKNNIVNLYDDSFDIIDILKEIFSIRLTAGRSIKFPNRPKEHLHKFSNQK